MPANWGALVLVYEAWKHGQLPRSGGSLDQPAALMDALRVIDSELLAIEEYRAKQRTTAIGV